MAIQIEEREDDGRDGWRTEKKSMKKTDAEGERDDRVTMIGDWGYREREEREFEGEKDESSETMIGYREREEREFEGEKDESSVTVTGYHEREVREIFGERGNLKYSRGTEIF
ncbi:hypothetical protein GBA52_003822 [Prunus armeniaca]|nr:hypothetical protein GBA52_003822 [Prunus armeniaca]